MSTRKRSLAPRSWKPFGKKKKPRTTMTLLRVAEEECIFDNNVNVNKFDFPNEVEYIQVLTGAGLANSYILSITDQRTAQKGYIETPLLLREWMNIKVNDEIEVRPYTFSKSEYLSTLLLEVDFYVPQTTTEAPLQEPYATDFMEEEFVSRFWGIALSVGQKLVCRFESKTILSLVVKSLEYLTSKRKPKKTSFGRVNGNSIIKFVKSERSTIKLIPEALPTSTSSDKNGIENRPKPINTIPTTIELIPKSLPSKSSSDQNLKTIEPRPINTIPTIFTADWDFSKLEVGGLGKQINIIFRHAFASRIVPQELVEKLGLTHVKGILLYGPPGTGKTIMARQIGKMLNASSLKIINGPELLAKYFGESEQNLRQLFVDAENDMKERGVNSGLHIIIFDEIDAIFKKRGLGSQYSSTVNDNMVNQLLTKIDGIDQLNNVILIGMTNRKDLIDEALLRPGRFEIQLEIGLPNEAGRLQILNIHTQSMRDNNKISSEVDLQELASRTKNYSGAEIAGLVRAAQSTALNRLIKTNSKIEIDPKEANKLRINRADFMFALENDIKPAFGKETAALENYVNRGIISWDSLVVRVLEMGQLLIQQARAPESGLVSVLIEGPPNAGKSALAANLALESKFPLIKLCSPDDMMGLTEYSKCAKIREIFNDAYQSDMSCLLIDNVEGLLEYNPIGQRFSNVTFQTLYILLKKEPPKGRKLLIICTSSRKSVLQKMEMLSAFTKILSIPNLWKIDHVMCVIQSYDIFTKDDLDCLSKRMYGCNLSIGIKRLLDVIARTRQIKPEHRLEMFFTELKEEGVVGSN